MKNKYNQDILKSIFLGLVSVMILTSIYYLNNTEEEEEKKESPYLKSDICYYAVNGIKSDYHYHFQLNVTINENRIEIPMHIGFETDKNGNTTFLHPIHTYDNSGRIHVETPQNTTAKLGFFFDIWGKDFSKDKILDYTVDEQHTLEMSVNGNKVDTFEETILEPYIFIDIEYSETN